MPTSILDSHYNNLSMKLNEFVELSHAICIIRYGWSNVRGNSVINFVLTTPKPIFITRSQRVKNLILVHLWNRDYAILLLILVPKKFTI